MIIVADSGSTKTDWALISDQGSEPRIIHTQGINPCHQAEDAISQILRSELLPQLDGWLSVDSVYFYGSGVRPEKQPVMQNLLGSVFPGAGSIEAHSDMLGACRALCGRHEGIACILGTGSNACYYDGERIAHSMPSLGYILGDEGSGADLGKRLIHALYSGMMPASLVAQFEQESGLSLPQIIARVYHEPMANRFLASQSEFILRHIGEPAIGKLVFGSFSDFLVWRVHPLHRDHLPVSFVGSIAWHYQAQLRRACKELFYTLGTVLRSPIHQLVKYHLP